ncbi:MAG: HD domain-containing protein [Butyrivibrio sp.]|nr:HD domain-containing protein [Acetatifactor muris]MCM1561132.1 HD domain-containing protein [Butyrivibrio sp.]
MGSKYKVTISIPDKAGHILKTLQAAGFEAYVVGGCVRDSLLGREPKDWDITTSARPEQVKALFPRTVDTGLKHGTVTVLQDGEGFEVTTYRIDGKYEDGRHPSEVTFTPSLEEDLLRRDFTINAMAYNDEAGLVDFWGGRQDMRIGVIRCVGNPEDRLREDALRILRAVRFAAQLRYHIDAYTMTAARRQAPNLSRISAERIQAELVKILLSDHPDYLRGAYSMGITKVILPELDRAMETQQNHPHHIYSVGEHILRSMKAVEPDKVLRLTMLLHDIGKPDTLTVDRRGITHFHGHAKAGAEMAREILHRLKFDNATINMVYRLVLYHDYGNDAEPTPRAVRRAVNKVGEDVFPLLFPIKYADISAQSDYMLKQKLERLKKWEQLYQEMCERQECVTLKDLAVTGSDLIAAGMEPGKELGEVLQKLLQLVLDRPSWNTKEKLLAEAEKLMN